MKKQPQKNLPTEEPVQPNLGGGKTSWWILVGLAGFVSAMLVYSSALNAPFVFDDQNQMFLDPNASKVPLSAWFGATRGLTTLSYWLNYRLGGTEPAGYHWLSLLLHLANSVLVTAIVRKLLEQSGTRGSPRDILAAFCGLVFLLHPLQTEAVVYIASRSEVLAVFLLWAAFGHFLYRNRLQKLEIVSFKID